MEREEAENKVYKNEFERCISMTSKAHEYQFDWEDPKDIRWKIQEEFEEVCEALDEMEDESDAHVIEELGDLLFVILNAYRLFKLDPEVILKQANDKFEARFQLMLSLIEKDGYDAKDPSFKSHEKYWEEAKRILREKGVTP